MDKTNWEKEFPHCTAIILSGNDDGDEYRVTPEEAKLLVTHQMIMRYEGVYVVLSTTLSDDTDPLSYIAGATEMLRSIRKMLAE